MTEGDVSRLRLDLKLYTATNLWIITKPGPNQPAELSTLRPNLAQQICNAKAERQKAETGRIRAIVLKARQEGISTWVAARIYHGCTLWLRRRGIVLADVFKRAGDIFEIYERFDEHNAIRPPKRSSRKARELSWITDSKLEVDTAQDPDSGRGGTRDFVHASEFAAWPYPSQTLGGLLESVPADAGEVWIESTAKGVGNEFHAMWEAAVQGESEFMPIFLPWWIDAGYRLGLTPEQQRELLVDLDPWERQAIDAGIPWEETPDEIIPAVLPSGAMFNVEHGRWRLTLEQLAWRRRKVREGGLTKFQQENPSTSDEAFLVSGSPFFDQAILKELLLKTSPPRRRGNFVGAGGGIAWSNADRGFVRIWEDPDPDGHYVLGGDTAEGRMSATSATFSEIDAERGGRDFSSADVFKVSELVDGPTPGRTIRVPCLRQVAQIHGREGLPPDVFAFQVWAAACWWSCPGRADQPKVRSPHLTGIERNHSSGQTTIRQLLDRWHHSNIFIHHRPNRRDDVVALEYGFITDGNTRPLILDELEQLVRTGGIQINSADTIREMRTFVRGGGKAEEGKTDDGRPEAQKGCHDDRVMSAAIGVHMRGYHSDGPLTAGSLPPAPDVPESLVEYPQDAPPPARVTVEMPQSLIEA
jgi:hypothetical protein